jgi:hypothetical protein
VRWLSCDVNERKYVNSRRPLQCGVCCGWLPCSWTKAVCNSVSALCCAGRQGAMHSSILLHCYRINHHIHVLTPTPLLLHPNPFAVAPQPLCCCTPTPLLLHPNPFAVVPQPLCCCTDNHQPHCCCRRFAPHSHTCRRSLRRLFPTTTVLY